MKVKITLKSVLSFVNDKVKKSNFQILLMHKRAKCSRRNININNSNTLKELHLQAKSIFAIKKADNERKWKEKREHQRPYQTTPNTYNRTHSANVWVPLPPLVDSLIGSPYPIRPRCQGEKNNGRRGWKLGSWIVRNHGDPEPKLHSTI